jgi:hypothetical protein
MVAEMETAPQTWEESAGDGPDINRAADGLARSAAAPIATYPSCSGFRPVPSKGTASNVALPP